MKPKFFRSSALFRAWLEKHHASSRMLLVGFYKKDSGIPSITYPEALDEALCFGWIDGLRKSLGAISYTIRFTPRRAGSIWSAVNIKRARELTALGRMSLGGLHVFREWDREKSRRYSYENRPRLLAPAYARRFRANQRAWTWFESQPPSYRRVAQWWVMSAKREETRERRLTALIASSAKGARTSPFVAARNKDR